MKKHLAGSILAILFVFLVACGESNSSTESSSNKSTSSGSTSNETITISGSTSVGPLAEKLAEKYKDTAPNKIEINQVGSSAGITNTINDVSQIGMSSRDLKEEEKASGLEETVIAYDGIAVVVNPKNKVSELTLEQVQKIFTGEITNWKVLGGDDKEIVVVSREDGSGSRDAFQEIVDFESEQLISNAIIANGNGNIKTIVIGNDSAIGYVSLEYLDKNVSPIAIDGIVASAENVIKGDYKISRPFILVYKSNLSAQAKAFIDYILSDEGQKIVEESGAIKLNN